MTVDSPFWDSKDMLTREVAARLDTKSILALRTTDARVRDLFNDYFKSYANLLFKERFGARADCEQELCLEKQIEKQKKFRELKAGHGWMVIDSDRNPQLVDYHAHFFGSTSSTLELLKAKYQFYREGALVDEGLENLLNFHDRIVEELNQKPLVPTHPLQDLRDRYRRLQTLSAERKILAMGFEKNQQIHRLFVKSLSLIERIVFFIFSLFQSSARKSQIPLLPSELDAYKEGIQLGQTKIVYQNEEIPLTISAKLHPFEDLYKPYLTFFIHSPSRQLGSFNVRREWTESAFNCYPYYSEKFFVEHTKGCLFNRRIHLEVYDTLGQDRETGDQPILRIITQIGVEIFAREPERELVITSHHQDADVFLAGGFTPPKRPGFRNGISYNHVEVGFDSKEVYEQRLIEARNRGLLFPDHRIVGSFDVSLQKSTPLNGTQFVTDGNSTFINYVVSETWTWEELIEKNRILYSSRGRILPKFFEVNLDCFEQPR